MSVEATTWAWRQPDLTPSERLVLVALADHASNDGACWPGLRGLAEKVDLTRRTVRRIVASLEERELLQREQRRDGDGRQTSNLIVLQMTDTPVASDRGEEVTDDRGGRSPVTDHEPSGEPSIRTEQDEAVDGVWAYWLGARQPKVTKLSSGTRQLLGRALNVGFDAQDLCLAVDGLLASDWHREHGKLQLSTIFTTGPGTQSFEDRIQSFIDKAPGSSRQPNGHHALPPHVRAALIAARNHHSAQFDETHERWFTANETLNKAALEAETFARERFGLRAVWAGDGRRDLGFERVAA